MPEGLRFRESSVKLEIRYAGESEINAETLVTSLDGFIKLAKAITIGTDPESYAKIIVKPPKEGSFELILALVINEAHSLFTKENYNAAKTIAGNIRDILSLKKFLNGKKPKEIGDVKNGSILVTNEDGAKTTVAAGSATQYFNNSHFDNCVVQIFEPISSDPNRKDFELKSSDGKLVIEKNHFKEMATKVVDETTQVSNQKHKQVVKVDLWVKKPDLVGNSKWGFVLDHNIEAEIIDHAFLEKVRKGTLKFGAGSMLPCRLQIEVGLDDKNEPLPAKYTVIEVTGDVFTSKDDDRQKKLFGDHK